MSVVALTDGKLNSFLSANASKLVCVIAIRADDEEGVAIFSELAKRSIAPYVSKNPTTTACIVDCNKCATEMSKFCSSSAVATVLGHKLSFVFYHKGEVVGSVATGEIPDTIAQAIVFMDANKPGHAFQGGARTLDGPGPSDDFFKNLKRVSPPPPPQPQPAVRPRTAPRYDDLIDQATMASQMPCLSAEQIDVYVARCEDPELCDPNDVMSRYRILMAMRATGTADKSALRAWLDKFGRGEVSFFTRSAPDLSETEIDREVDLLLSGAAPQPPKPQPKPPIQTQRQPEPKPAPAPAPAPEKTSFSKTAPLQIRVGIWLPGNVPRLTECFPPGATVGDMIQRLKEKGVIPPEREFRLQRKPGGAISEDRYGDPLQDRQGFDISF